ncbi:MAG: FAD-dependent oxidoreductase [Bacteroidetes bacterium]|nr:FAD-dependent oxidoreductase [Bacteroidota bacterium]
MESCIVIGGGIAGLTSAAYLTKQNIKVTLLESSPKLGGRAYSFTEQKSNDVVDNGQHILMGCYSDTINFLKLIGAKENFIYQKRLCINFLTQAGKLVRLKSFTSIYPFNLIFALLNFKAITYTERLSLIRFVIKLPFISHQKLSDKNIRDWLKEEKQSDATIKSLWEIIAIGALNTNIDKASAFIFREILMKIFFNGNFASTIILPKNGLSDAYVKNAKKYIESNGGKIKLSSSVKEFIISDNKIVGIKTAEEVYKDFDYVISAIPFYAFNNIFSELFWDEKIEFEYSSILNIHIWLKNNTMKEQFYGLIDSPVHWIFNKGNHINLVISDADYLIDKPAEEIYNMCINELIKYTELEESDILHYKVLKEKRATFVPSNKNNYIRPSSKTKIANLFLAGDWTDTGLPSTIESAVKSGRVAAELILAECQM